jgi:alpha-beta hydrolase superfamily lysophospholipase
VVNHLVARRYAVYGFDLRGHGRSPGERGHISAWEEYREDVHAFLEMIREREPDRPLFLMGHSLGGLIALEFALYHPEGLQGVIGSGTGLSASGLSPLLLLIARVLSRILPSVPLKTGLDATTLSRDPAVVKAYQDDPLVHGIATPRLGTESFTAIDWTLAQATEWQVPLLFLHGGADRLVPIEPTRLFFERVPIADKQMITYDGGYHEPHNDIMHQQATADLEGWIAQHLS